MLILHTSRMCIVPLSITIINSYYDIIESN